MEQELHYDFNITANLKLSKLSYLVIAALMPNTKIVVCTNCIKQTVILNEGDVFIGRGDLIHAGAAYDIENIRCHWYADFVNNSRQERKTYLYTGLIHSLATVVFDFYANYRQQRGNNIRKAIADVKANKLARKEIGANLSMSRHEAKVSKRLELLSNSTYEHV